MQQKFIERVGFIVFHHIKIRIIAIARHFIAVGFVPLGVFRAEVFCRYKFGVETHAVLFRGGFVGFENGFQTALHKFDVFGVVAHSNTAGFGRFGHAVDADGEKLFVERDKAGIVNRQHAGGLIFFHQLAVGILIAVDFAHFCCQVAPVLLEPVHIERDHINRAGGHAACAQGVGKSAVVDLVAQATARGKRIGIVGKINEKRIALGQFLRHFVGKLFILAFALVGEHGGGNHRKSEHRFAALLIKPFEKIILQPRHALPLGFGEIGKHKIAEHGLEIMRVIKRNIPKHALIAARGGGLVDAVYHMLQVVGHFVRVGA